jgi:arabinose-5-phosphate isomerase
MALGDALAVALLDARGFRPRTSPARTPAARWARLLTRARPDARGEDVPASGPRRLWRLMREMSARAWAPRPWSTPGRVLGIFTDGDLRRLIEPGATCAAAAGQVMHASPRTISRSALAVGRRADGAHRITSCW